MPEPTTPSITVHFGKPEHGWLPVNFQAGTFRLDLDASDVPLNPLESLCEALVTAAAGGSCQVLWFLEPAECWFTFENQVGLLALTITERPNRTRALTTVLHLTGTVGDVLLPFYRALQEFTTRAYPERHWPRLTGHRIERLGRLLHSQL